MKRKSKGKEMKQHPDSIDPRRSARRFPLSEHIDSIINAYPEEEHLAALLRLEQSYDAACVALQEVTISDSVKRAIAIDQLARCSFDHAELAGNSCSDLRNHAKTGRHECESRWRYNDLW